MCVLIQTPRTATSRMGGLQMLERKVLISSPSQCRVRPEPLAWNGGRPPPPPAAPSPSPENIYLFLFSDTQSSNRCPDFTPRREQTALSQRHIEVVPTTFAVRRGGSAARQHKGRERVRSKPQRRQCSLTPPHHTPELTARRMKGKERHTRYCARTLTDVPPHLPQIRPRAFEWQRGGKIR